MGIHKCPNIMEHIATHCAENCICANYRPVTMTLPIKMAACFQLSNLQIFQYRGEILFLEIPVKNLERPNDDGWENYETFFNLCPKLKGVNIFTKKGNKFIDLQDSLDELPETIQEIWEKRIAYLRSFHIDIMSSSEYESTIHELCKKI